MASPNPIWAPRPGADRPYTAAGTSAPTLSPGAPSAPPTQPFERPWAWQVPPATPRPPAPSTETPPASRPGRSRRLPAVVVVVLCLRSGLGGGAVMRLTAPDPAPAQVAALPLTPVSSAPAAEAPAAPPLEGTVAAVAQKAKPSVVAVEAGDGAGSGVVVGNGHVITNAHVVEGSRNVTVRLADGTELAGRVLGSDPDVDIALVEVDDTSVPAAVLGSALTLHPGDTVVAVGNPLGLEGSVSAGVVSALGRYVPGDTGGIRAAIQTDAAINPGNSGGALLNGSGEVVGITAAKIGGGADNIGFAIPIDVARAVAADLAAGRSTSHPYLGISGSEVDARTAEALGGTAGARITAVGSDSPAAAAGLSEGDVITSIDGVKVGSLFDLSVILATHHAGDTVKLGLASGPGVDVTLAERPA